MIKREFRYKGYTGSVEYSLKYKVFFGKLLGVEDLCYYEAKSKSHLKIAFIKAVREYDHLIKKQ